jgi:hypothetical protein
MRRHGAPIGGKAKPAAVAVAGDAPRRDDWAKKKNKGGQEELMPDEGPEADRVGTRSGGDRGGAQALRRPLRLRGGRGLARIDDPGISLPEVAFAGRSNVGKSSLVNALTGRRTLARTSSSPGHTRQINFFNLAGQLHPRRPAGLRLRPGLALDEGDVAGSRLGLSARPADAQAHLPADRLAARRERQPTARR